MLTEQNLALAQSQTEDFSPGIDLVENRATTSLHGNLEVSPVAESGNARSAVPIVTADTVSAVTQDADGFNKPLPSAQWLTPSNSIIVQPSVNAHRHQGLVEDGEVATSDLNCVRRPADDAESEDDEESGADADGMGAIASSTTNEAGAGGKPVSEKAYFGPSSTLGFMKHIQDVFRPTKGTRAHKTTRKDNNHEHGESSNQPAKTHEPSNHSRIPTYDALDTFWFVCPSQIYSTDEGACRCLAFKLLDSCSSYLSIPLQVCFQPTLSKTVDCCKRTPRPSTSYACTHEPIYRLFRRLLLERAVVLLHPQPGIQPGFTV